MFQTKKDVDRHVRSSFARLRDNEVSLNLIPFYLRIKKKSNLFTSFDFPQYKDGKYFLDFVAVVLRFNAIAKEFVKKKFFFLLFCF